MLEPVTTIPSRALEVWRRLYTRFNLEPAPASVSPDVSKTIVPITSADELLKEYGADSQDTDEIAIGASGTVVISTVPSGERWVVYTMNIFRVSGDNQVTTITLTDVSRGLLPAIDAFSGTSGRVFILATPLTLEEGDQISVTTDGSGSVATVFRMRLWLSRENSFR